MRRGIVVQEICRGEAGRRGAFWRGIPLAGQPPGLSDGCLQRGYRDRRQQIEGPCGRPGEGFSFPRETGRTALPARGAILRQTAGSKTPLTGPGPHGSPLTVSASVANLAQGGNELLNRGQMAGSAEAGALPYRPSGTTPLERAVSDAD